MIDVQEYSFESANRRDESEEDNVDQVVRFDNVLDIETDHRAVRGGR